jgi:hypothetical protein
LVAAGSGSSKLALNFKVSGSTAARPPGRDFGCLPACLSRVQDKVAASNKTYMQDVADNLLISKALKASDRPACRRPLASTLPPCSGLRWPEPRCPCVQPFFSSGDAKSLTDASDDITRVHLVFAALPKYTPLLDSICDKQKTPMLQLPGQVSRRGRRSRRRGSRQQLTVPPLCALPQDTVICKSQFFKEFGRGAAAKDVFWACNIFGGITGIEMVNDQLNISFVPAVRSFGGGVGCLLPLLHVAC